MTKINQLFGLLILLVICFSCKNNPTVSIADERAEILRLHNAQRDNHFKKDSVAFAQELSDHFISVNAGKITRPKREETLSRYKDYFSSVEFLQWNDVSEPIIRLSDDGTMAYTVVDKMVVVNYEDENGNLMEESTHFAWTAIYKKYDDEWKVDCVTSTFR